MTSKHSDKWPPDGCDIISLANLLLHHTAWLCKTWRNSPKDVAKTVCFRIRQSEAPPDQRCIQVLARGPGKRSLPHTMDLVPESKLGKNDLILSSRSIFFFRGLQPVVSGNHVHSDASFRLGSRETND